MDHHEFTGSEKCCLQKQTWLSLALLLVCLIVAFMSSYKMDFSSCGIMPGFSKSSKDELQNKIACKNSVKEEAIILKVKGVT